MVLREPRLWLKLIRIKELTPGEKSGINTDVPSLSRLCLFKVKQYQLNQSQLPDDLHKKLAQPKV